MRFGIKLLVFLLVSIIEAFAGNRAAHWYFGEKCGIDFSSGAPVAVFDGELDTQEGCASISDTSGNLLFYTDGISVWNAEHDKMPKGSGLNGHSSSTQSAVIMPMPASDSMYYIFTIDDRSGDNGCSYSIVDMSLDGGLGDISEKNIPLAENLTEKLLAVKHVNCDYFWIILHRWNSNEFLAYLVTDEGIDTVPVISGTGSVHEGSIRNKIGYMKCSPDGKRIASVVHDIGAVDILNFNPATGRLSGAVTFRSSNYSNGYGAEFSPDSKKLYFNSYRISYILFIEYHNYRIYQIDLSSDSYDDIVNSISLIYNRDLQVTFNSNQSFGAMQLAPDGKIYVAKHDVGSLGVITLPNNKGSACNYQNSGFSLGGRTSTWGLPTFSSDYFNFNTKIWLPDTLAKIGDRRFKVPVFAAQSCSGNRVLRSDWEAVIRLDPSVYYVDSVTSGKLRRYYENNELVLQITGDSIELAQDTIILTELFGSVLLDEDSATTLEFDFFAWGDPEVLADTVSGSLKAYSDCEIPERFFKFTDSADMQIIQHISGETEFIIHSAETGTCSLEIYDIRGNLTEDTELFFAGNEYRKTVNVRSDKIAQGVYLAVFKSKSKVISKMFCVVR